MRLAILRTDEVRSEFQAEFGDYPQMFEALISKQAPEIHFTHIDAREFDETSKWPDPARFDVYLITGSKHSVYEDLPWIKALAQFLEGVIAREKKVIGICFGHQLLAHYFGGRVGEHAGGWAVGVHESVTVGEASWRSTGDASVRLLSSHKDQVTALPDNAEVYLTNEFCPIAGFYVGDRVLTVQGHPEFRKPYSAALMQYRREILGDDVFTEGMESLTSDTDEDKWVRWMLSFIRGEFAAT